MIRQIEDERIEAVDRADALNFKLQQINDEYRMLQVRNTQLENQHSEDILQIQGFNEQNTAVTNQNLDLHRQKAEAHLKLEVLKQEFQVSHQEYESLQIHKKDSIKIIAEMMQDFS